MEEETILGGATLWARQTIESEIFMDKPHVWFKIWFYLVSRVSHKDTKKYKRGETFYHQEWISAATGATPDQIKKCLQWLREAHMISTTRSTRGTWIFLPQYSHYQTLDNYYYGIKSPDEAREKHERSTREARRYNKNDKNDKNNTIATTSVADEPFDSDEYISSMRDNPSPHIRLLGWYFKKRGSVFPDEKTIKAEIKRWVKDASFIVKFGNDKIISTHAWVESKYPEEWNLSTIRKFITEK